MLKNILKIVLLIGILVYLVFAFTKLNKPNKQAKCIGTDVEIVDSANVGIITKGEVIRLLKQGEVQTDGKFLSDINTCAVEKLLRKSPFIDSVICYKTPANTLRIVVTQLRPALRIIANNGDDYYITIQGQRLPKMHYTAYLPIVSGHITTQYAKEQLPELATFIQSSTFWQDQIEQIYVDQRGHVSLTTRIGNQVISLGSPTNISHKMANLKSFYKKILAHVGWNKYEKINLEYANQIICTKKK